jgi:N-acetylneuraminic acid mutarotase
MGISLSKSVALLLVLVFLTASCITVKAVSAASPNSWTSKAPMNEARSSLGVAVVNGKIYAIGGSTQSGSMPNSIPSTVYGFKGTMGVDTNEEYDPATDTWTYKASMPTPRLAFATAVYQNKIYCIGGQAQGNYTGANEVYDPATDTWETKTPMPTARGWLTAGVVNGKIYLIGGEPNGPLNEVYDPATDSWITKTPAPTALSWTWASSAASAVFNSKIYFVGGEGSGKLNQIYDVETDKWSSGASSPSSVDGGAAGATTGVWAPKQIYILGEIVAARSEEPTFVRVYDPVTGSWAFGADAPTSRYNFGVAVVNDILYAIGGHTHSQYPLGIYAPVATNEQYTPFGYGTVPPAVAVVSPENRTYNVTSVSLVFTVNKPVVWIGFSLDEQDNVTITSNTTLSGLSSGVHNIAVYAKDALENMGASETISFTIAKEPETFSIRLVAAVAIVVAAVVLVAAVGVGLSAYLNKRK